MSPHADLDLEDTKHDTSASMMHHRPHLVTKGLSLQKISFGQSFIKIMVLHCDLKDNCMFFWQALKGCDNLPSNQQSKGYGGESYTIHISRHCALDLEEIHNLCVFVWHHSGTWCCTTIPRLFTKVECSEDILSTTLFLSGVTLRKSRSRSL